MADRRRKDVNWTVADEKGSVESWQAAAVAVLMDIRDRLDVLRCPNFVSIPHKLDRIEREVRMLRLSRRRKRKTEAARRERIQAASRG